MDQYQRSTLRVFTHFMTAVAKEGEGPEQQNFLLGSDWQVEVTQLVRDSLRVQDSEVARLLEGQVLVGVAAGTTKLQVWVCVCVCVCV